MPVDEAEAEAEIKDLAPAPAGVDWALCCLPCEVGWPRSGGMTCWVCGRLGHVGVLPMRSVTVRVEDARAESRAIEAATNTYESVERPRSA